MQQTLSIVIVGGLAVIIWLLSQQRVKRLQVYTDRFAKAFCEAYDHVLPSLDVTDTLRYERNDDGTIRVLSAEEQPESIRALFQQGVDAFVMERMRTMYSERDEAQSLLTTVNLVGEKYNAVLNHCYDLANQFFSFVDDPNKIQTDQDLENFQTYLTKQRFLRETTLAAIVSARQKTEIAAAMRV